VKLILGRYNEVLT
jgi:hypothetical protein